MRSRKTEGKQNEKSHPEEGATSDIVSYRTHFFPTSFVWSVECAVQQQVLIKENSLGLIRRN